jgi:hypothetical protein
MALKITVEDLATGEKGEATVPDNDYILITDGSAYMDGVQTYQHTHVITVKGLKNGIPRLDVGAAQTRAAGPAPVAEQRDGEGR